MSQQNAGPGGPGTEDAYYEALGGNRYRPTLHAQGAWQESEQHMAAAAGILAHCLDRHEPREGLRVARLGYEILGMIPLDEVEIRTRTLRPGRTIELVQAEMVAGGRTVVRATAWRLQTSDTTAAAATEEEPLAFPEDTAEAARLSQWSGGYIRSLEIREAEPLRPGRGAVWLRPRQRLVQGEESPDWVRLVGLADTANGTAPLLDPKEGWMFPNTDLQVHLHRLPEGEWLGLRTQNTVGPDGIGLTSAVLHDQHGPFGRTEQILTVRRAPQGPAA